MMEWYNPLTWFKKEEENKEEWLNKTEDMLADREEKAQVDEKEERVDTVSKDIAFRTRLDNLKKELDKAETMVEWNNIKARFDSICKESASFVAGNKSLEDLIFNLKKEFANASQRIQIRERING